MPCTLLLSLRLSYADCAAGLAAWSGASCEPTGLLDGQTARCGGGLTGPRVRRRGSGARSRQAGGRGGGQWGAAGRARALPELRAVAGRRGGRPRLEVGGLHAISHMGVALDICASCKRPRAFDLHNNAAIRCTSGRGPTSAARVVFDAQEHPLLGKIKVPEVV